MTREEGKAKIEQLVTDFARNEVQYLSKNFNETEARIRFIDPMLSALGWELEQTGQSKEYWDVHREYSLRGERPDYAFRVNREVKFFVEAKAPHVRLTEKSPVFQAKSYAFSFRKAPIVILTDFEEFRVFNALQRPDPDNPLQGLLKPFDLKYTDYVKKWDTLYNTFSKEAVYAGKLDELAKTLTRTTKKLDEEFLSDIIGWRETLARNMAVRNPDLSVDDLNEAIQRILDRLIFIRNLEDRKIEADDTLLNATQLKENIYAGLIPIFSRLNGEYNGLLFKSHFSEKLLVDDAVINKIIVELSPKKSPFRFDLIEPEILGQIYERFLGSKIRLTEGHRAKVEEKPEVRKAGGVYYTPQYIVDYIVKNTVGKKIEGLTPDEIKAVKILDPACGSGSFLLGAFGYLMRYHCEWYAAHRSDKKYHKEYMETPDGIRLSAAKKADILKNNIFGVDIDREATEVAMMSLYLKLLDEGFDKPQAMLFMRGSVLPDLTRNIKCGNSLIGSDFYATQGQLNFDMTEMKRINAFDWDTEFPEIFNPSTRSRGGFDVVIGNPPYVRQEMLGEFKVYFQRIYQAYQGTADLYVYFIERAVSLLRPGGMFAYIVANKWMRTKYGEPLRRWLKQQGLLEILDFGDLPVFAQATTYPCIITIRKEAAPQSFAAADIETLDFTSLADYAAAHVHSVKMDALDDAGWSLADESSKNLLTKLRAAGQPLGEYLKGEIYRGVLTGLNEAFVIDAETRARLIAEDARSAELIKPFLAGRDIKRYQTPHSERYLIFSRRGIDIKQYSAIEKHLLPFKEQLIPKPAGYKGQDWKGRKPGNYKWFEIQDTIDYYAEFAKAKIIYPNICKQPEFAFDTEHFYANQKCFIIPCDDKYLLGILNSRVCFFLFRQILPKLRGDFYEPSYVYFKDFPIRTVDFTNPADKTRHDQLVQLVATMLSLQPQLAAAKSERDKTLLQRQIALTDDKIDRLVYELYDLTAEEIAVVEGKPA